MKDVAIAIKEFLTAKATFSLNVGGWPANVDKAVLITVTGGRPPYPHLAINFPSVQIMVRGNDYQEASAEMSLICNALLGISTQVLNTDTYRSCNQIGDVIYLGQDANGRKMFSANFWYIVLPSDLGNRMAIT